MCPTHTVLIPYLNLFHINSFSLKGSMTHSAWGGSLDANSAALAAAGTTDESHRNTDPRNISLDARDAVLHDAPSAYCCPIGLDVMRDPVVLSAVLILIFPNSPWSPVRHPFGSACDALA